MPAATEPLQASATGALRADRNALKQHFEREGYALLQGVVPAQPLGRLSHEITAQFGADVAKGRLFAGGGSLSGHLNCFPGAQSRFVHEALEGAGVFELVQSLSPRPLRQPNVGCNLNLPGSHAQNEHVDGYAAEPFLIVNVAAVDTTLENGAMEIITGSQRQNRKFWEVALARLSRRRVTMRQGDVVVRISTLWHRGMPNSSSVPRPMLAFTWEGGGSTLTDPYLAHGGHITFLPNRFRTDWRGRLVERAFVAAPRIGKAYHAMRSILGDIVL
jgi:hypothetical protein